MQKKMMKYYRIRDIVSYIYINYIAIQIDRYGRDNVDGKSLAEESLLLILDILNNKPEMTDEEIANLAIKESHIKRPWQGD